MKLENFHPEDVLREKMYKFYRELVRKKKRPPMPVDCRPMSPSLKSMLEARRTAGMAMKRAIVDCIGDDEILTAAQIAARCGSQSIAISTYLRQMAEQGVIFRDGIQRGQFSNRREGVAHFAYGKTGKQLED